MDIANRSILVTGGSSGLGAATVTALVSRGAGVIVADLSPPSDEQQQAWGDRAVFFRTDVTSETDVADSLARGQDRFGPLGGVVSCAGILHAERLLSRTGDGALAAFARVIHVNLVGTFNVVRLAAEQMALAVPDEDGERGVVVLTSSVAAFDGQIGQAAYAASKGGVASLTLPLARELGTRGIRVLSLAPGVFETPMMQAAPDKVRDSLLEQTPFPHRFGHPDEFAQLVLHVFDNRMLNGCTLRLDGGLRMGAR